MHKEFTLSLMVIYIKETLKHNKLESTWGYTTLVFLSKDI